MRSILYFGFLVNFSYLMLAIIRYVCICLDDGYRLRRYFRKKADCMMVSILSLLILIPAIIWAILLFYGSDATGRSWHLTFSHEQKTVVAFQDIGDRQERIKSPILLTMICIHLFQFMGTISVYCKILYAGYMSTTRVATRVVTDDNMNKKRETLNIHQVRKIRRFPYGNEPKNTRNDTSETQHAVKFTSSEMEPQRNRFPDSQIEGRDSSKNICIISNETPILKSLNSMSPAKPNTSGRGNNFQLLRSNTIAPVLKEHQFSVADEENIINANFHNNKSIPNSKGPNNDRLKQLNLNSKARRKRLRSKSMEVENLAGRKTIIQPKLGDRIVNIPYTNVVLCLSQKDIICTIGLSCQLASLIVTFILSIIGFRTSGKIITIYEFLVAYYCLEVALIINSVVDPILCLMFSSDFRDALKTTLCSCKLKRCNGRD